MTLGVVVHACATASVVACNSVGERGGDLTPRKV
jgi:hypothetical protein